MWDLFRSVLDPSVHTTYVERLETACKELRVGFLDANGALAAAHAWLYVDQVHLNDEGNRTVTEILKAELNLISRPADHNIHRELDDVPQADPPQDFRAFRGVVKVAAP
jgi:hypothetical protein